MEYGERERSVITNGREAESATQQLPRGEQAQMRELHGDREKERVRERHQICLRKVNRTDRLTK